MLGPGQRSAPPWGTMGTRTPGRKTRKAHMPRTLHDGFGCSINYLRISVTDTCNYRYVHRMPKQRVPARFSPQIGG